MRIFIPLCLIVIIFVWSKIVYVECVLLVSVVLFSQLSVGRNQNGKKHCMTKPRCHCIKRSLHFTLLHCWPFLVSFPLYYCTIKWRRLKLSHFSTLFRSAWWVLVFISSEMGNCLFLPLFLKIYCICVISEKPCFFQSGFSTTGPLKVEFLYLKRIHLL